MLSQYHFRAAAPDAVARIQNELNLPHFVAKCLVARGVTTPKEAEEFMTPSLDRDWLNPYDIPGMKEAADAVEQALLDRKHIIVFGDFDLDGISATTVLTRGLRALGGRATPFIPRRFEEGYGLSLAAFERMRELDPGLIITVDCGISCRDEVAAIVEQGVPVVVTDHHEPGAQVPQGVPVCDPKTDDNCSSAILAGVGVALKLVQVLGSRRGYPHLWRSYVDLATLGTVADLMPMRGENRALVAEGLARLNDKPRPAIAALIAVSGSEGKELTSTNLSFTLIPRLNAAGRMGDAQVALDLLMCDSFDEATELAQRLEETNDRRRAIEAELAEAAEEKVAKEYDGERVIVVAGEGWHEGVKGIVASRLVGKYGVPALLFTIDGEEARGSGRSVGNVNLFAALEHVSDLLTRFGGHEAAVGVTLPAANLPEFTRRLAEYMEHVPESELRPTIDLDAEVDLSDLTIPSIETLEKLAPFGQENPMPRFLVRNVTLDRRRAVGADKNHLSCQMTNGRVSVNGISFGCKNIDVLMETESMVNAVFTAQVEEWCRVRRVKAQMERIMPICECDALRKFFDPTAAEFVSRIFMTAEERRDAQAEGSKENSNAQYNGYKIAGVEALQGGSVSAAQAGEGAGEPDRQAVRAHWRELAQRDAAALQQEVVRAIIGDVQPHATQRELLDRLQRGESALGIMATGRGKSLVFQVHAACMALGQGKASLFVYPLRALMADQSFHIQQQFEKFGLECAVLNGECSQEEREHVYAGLADGTIDIVLTTPEYLSYHADRIAASNRIGFMVVDEAHHIGLAKAGQRTAYTELGDVLQRLGNPTVLAVTATASDDVSRDICRTLGIGDVVVDHTSRENLKLNDQRNVYNRLNYLAHIIARGGKTVVYVNSRKETIDIARRLRRRVPQLAPCIGFYNAGLSREDRKRIENMFRDGTLRVLVATSAFGEGIDIPDIRNVVLYNMPFNDVEFNQMSGRAGRDGQESWVHLLYNTQDVQINEGILCDMTPDRDVMAQVYRCLKSVQKQTPGDFFRMKAGTLAGLASSRMCKVSPTAAACGLNVFTELGLIERKPALPTNDPTHYFRIVENAARVDLADSVRYREGLDEIEGFRSFRDWAICSNADDLRDRMTHPIVPEEGAEQ